MTKKNKKAADTGHKEVTAFVRAKTSPSSTKSMNMDLNRPFLTPSSETFVSTVSPA